MNEIKCPKCKEVFQVDESGYAAILKQVHDNEFHKEIEEREKSFEQEKQLAIKDAEKKKDEEINALKMQLQALEAEKSKISSEKETAVELAVTKAKSELNIEIEQFKTEKATEEIRLKGEIQTLKESHQEEINHKDEIIGYYKDLKAKMSTKMVGETLEQHCFNEFNTIRATAFPDAYFEKDNDAKSGSKGDFIFRNYEDEIEFVSIMFEMKNELDETATKHKNEDFFKELDKDRNEKGCEYAVLVSLLEADSDLYNQGIVDVSYKYPKMYVVRPQFFIPIISLLNNAAKNSLEYKKELAIAREQNIDINHFEENINTFKDAFGKNYANASKKFNEAIDEIDKTISHLNKVRESLLTSENHLRLANNKAEDLTIKKLTKNCPSVAKMFDDLKKEEE